jgi:hypothetical protein
MGTINGPINKVLDKREVVKVAAWYEVNYFQVSKEVNMDAIRLIE